MIELTPRQSSWFVWVLLGLYELVGPICPRFGWSPNWLSTIWLSACASIHVMSSLCVCKCIPLNFEVKLVVACIIIKFYAEVEIVILMFCIVFTVFSLFPTMPCHNYVKVAPLVKALLHKHGISYVEKSLLTAMADLIGYISLAELVCSADVGD